jgi:hypothetical protein
MIDRALADVVLTIHLLFIAFVFGGVVLVRRWPHLAWMHVPAVLWGSFVNVANITCPLTPLENWFRVRAELGGYPGSFVEHYLVPIVYGRDQAPTAAVVAGGFLVLGLNLVAYALLIGSRRRAGPGPRAPAGS